MTYKERESERPNQSRIRRAQVRLRDTFKMQMITRAERKSGKIAKINGIEHVNNIPEDVPIIFTYSHKQPPEGEPWPAESNSICKAIRNSDKPHRIVEVLAAPASPGKQRLRQMLSPIRIVILTAGERYPNWWRKKHNKRAILKIGERAAQSPRPYAATIAPDGAETLSSYQKAINPQKIKTTGLDLLIQGFKDAGFSRVAIIPVKFDYDNKDQITLGPDYYDEYADSNSDRDKQREIIGEKINSL